MSDSIQVIIWNEYRHEKKDPNVAKVISNAVRWAAPSDGPKITFGNVQPLEKIGK